MRVFEQNRATSLLKYHWICLAERGYFPYNELTHLTQEHEIYLVFSDDILQIDK